MALARLLAAKMHMDDGGTGVMGLAGRLSALFGCDRNRVLARIGQDAVQGAGQDCLVHDNYPRVPGAGGVSGGPAKHWALAIHVSATAPCTCNPVSASARV